MALVFNWCLIVDTNMQCLKISPRARTENNFHHKRLDFVFSAWALGYVPGQNSTLKRGNGDCKSLF